MAGGTWDKLEQVFEDRVERALSKLGIYTHNDLQRLAERVDELAEAVNRLLAAKGAAPKIGGGQGEAAGKACCPERAEDCAQMMLRARSGGATSVPRRRPRARGQSRFSLSTCLM